MKTRNVLLPIILFTAVSASIQADDIHDGSDTIRMRYTSREVVIESFKQNSNLHILPVSATLLSAARIKENNITNIKEITAFAPNLFMPDYGSRMTSPVYIRGIGAAKNAPSVGLYVDGVPYFDRSTFDVDISDIDRIEVLRGPQGAIYGRNTMGGIINISTKSPFNTKGTYLNLSAGNYNNYQTGISHYGNADNRIGYSLSGNFLHKGGYFDNKHTGKKADPMDAISTRARLGWRIKPGLTANLIFACEYSDQDGYPYRVYDKNSGETKNVDYNAPSLYRRNMSTAGLNLEYVTDDFKLGSQTSFQFYDGKQGLDQDFSPKDLYYVDFYQRQQMYSQEFNIKSIKRDSKYNWQFGVFGFHQNYFQTNEVDYRTKDSLAIQLVRNPAEGFALYHQSSINDVFLPRLSFVLGVRYDWETTKSALTRTSINKGGIPVTPDPVKDKMSCSQFTPKGSVQYSFNRNGLLFFSVAKGYKTGGFNTTVEGDVDRTFKPEHSWCYELGSKSFFFNGLLYFDLTFFHINWNDQQVNQTKDTGQGFLLRNAGKSVSRGMEFSAQANPFGNLDLQLSYGYTNAGYKDYKDPGKNLVYDKKYLPMIPRNTLAIAANYTINTNRKWIGNIVLNGQYTGAGKLYWNDANDVCQPYYGLFNAKISFVKKGLSVNVWTKNITGKDYISYYFASSGNFVQKGKPFTCGVNMNLEF
ncbi:MAG: TonB-dependent receptor [Prevotella sp.]|nr:TonB-dependent receptor [Prevotella sp.]